MKVQGLRRYSEPSYPTAEALRGDPTLLEQRPSRWTSSGAASLLSVALSAGVAGCSEPHRRPTPEPTDGGLEGSVEDAAPPSHPAGALVFEGGTGRGMMGCIVNVPPVFLTEEEAWVVIEEELSTAGVDLETPGPTYEGLEFEEGDVDVTLDGEASSLGVAVEFVSFWDLLELDEARGGGDDHDMDLYSFLETARALARELGRPESLTIGIFYDPIHCYCIESEGCGPCMEVSPDRATAESRAVEDLRVQVRQFVNFLQEAGVI